jgi:hypothetical protein
MKNEQGEFYFWPAHTDGCWSQEQVEEILKKIKELNK